MCGGEHWFMKVYKMATRFCYVLFHWNYNFRRGSDFILDFCWVSCNQHSTLMLRQKDSSQNVKPPWKLHRLTLSSSFSSLFLAPVYASTLIFLVSWGLLPRDQLQEETTVNRLAIFTTWQITPWRKHNYHGKYVDRCANPPDGLASNNAWCIYGWDETVGTVTQAKDNSSKSPLHRSEQQNFWSSRQLPVLRQGITHPPYASRIPAT